MKYAYVFVIYFVIHRDASMAQSYDCHNANKVTVTHKDVDKTDR